MEFRRLIESLAEKIGIEINDEGGAAAIGIDGLTVLLHEADDDLLLLHADLGEVPVAGRDALAVAALRANSISWVTTIIVAPSRARAFITLSTSPVSSGSRALVGSSKKRTLGFGAIARAMATRCCCPPDSCEG